MNTGYANVTQNQAAEYRNPRARKGRYEVTQPIANGSTEEMRTDFDAERWAPVWLPINGMQILRMEELSADGDSFEYQDFSQPVSVRFVREV